MSFIPKKPRTYEDGRTKQAFKDSTDINRLLGRAAKAGTLSHLEQFGGRYGDFADYDFQEHQNMLAEASSLFERLPSEVRREFQQSPADFFEFVNTHTPEELREKLPQLAEPGNQMLDLNPRTANAVASEPTASESPPADPPDPVTE